MPSSKASAMARRPASGVRRSCETHATSSRRPASAWRSFSRASAAHMLARARRRPAQSPAARLTAPAAARMISRTCRSWSEMNMPNAALRVPASTLRTVTSSRTAMWAVTDRPRRGPRRTARPATATISDPTRAMAKVTTRSRIGVAQLVAVANAPDRADAARLGRVVLDLLPQPSHMDRHSGLVAEGPAPNLLEHLGAAEDPARVAHEEDQQVELADGQRDLGPR